MVQTDGKQSPEAHQRMPLGRHQRRNEQWSSAMSLSGLAQRLRIEIEQWIREHPNACLSTALLTGVVMGWLIKRRK